MESRTLTSEFEELKPVKEKTIPEYYLGKAKHYAELGRDYWLVDGLTGEKHYFKNFDEETRKIASAFYKLGLRKGEFVLYMIRDLSKVSLLLTGVCRANGVLRASYDVEDAATILHRVTESKCRFIVCEEDGVPVCTAVADKTDWEMSIITVRRSPSSTASLQEFLEEDDGAAMPELQITEEDPAVVLSTSGTTGMAKGAVHTHRNMLYSMRSFERLPFTYPKPNLIATKATHVSGTAMELIAMASGKTSVVVSSLTRDNILNAASKYKVGFAFGFPTYLASMVGPEARDYDFSSIEIIFSGGVSITPAIRQTLRQLPNVTDIVLGYGLTESMACTTSAILKEDDERETPGMRDLPDFSVGKPVPGLQIQCRDPESGQAVGQDQRGEICVKSLGIFQSYFLNPEATKDAFYADGYFRTGDIGYYDANGFIYIVDRLKDIFKYYNDHISPTELEDVIGKHPKVKEVCVVGVVDPGGHIPRAFIGVHPNSGPKHEVAEEIKEFANSKLASYKHLRGGVVIVDELPKGKTGKMDRQQVAKLPME